MEQQSPAFLKNPEIVKRLLITLGCITAYAVGRAVPIPGLHPDFLAAILSGQSETALRSVSILALGVGPYLCAAVLLSIIRATGRIRALDCRDADERNVVYRAARWLTALIAVGQGALAAAVIAKSPGAGAGMGFLLPAAATLAAGALLVLWLAEEITENGIGNGVLLLIFIEAAVNAPRGISGLNALVENEELHALAALGIAVLVILTAFAAVWIESAHRSTPVQYAKRVVGRMLMGGQQTAMPVKVNPAGALAVIAAATAAAWPGAFLDAARHPAVYFPLLGALIVAFSWLYRTAGVDPRDVAGQIQRQGGFVPGIRSGEPLIGHFARLLDRLSLGSAFIVAFLIIGLAVVTRLTGSSKIIGAVSIFVTAAVTLDFIGQLQTRVTMGNLGGNIPRPGGAMRGGGRHTRPSKRRKRRR